MATNPLLAEINNLSPGAKAALASAHQAASQATAPPPLVPNSATPKLGPAVGPKAPLPDTGPPPTPAGLAPPNSGPMPAAIATPGPSEAPPSIKAPPGTIPADTAELARKESTGSGISQIHGMIENSRLGQAHPLLGKILGWGAQIPAELGDIGGSAIAPEITRNIPGTEYHHDVLVKQGQKQLAGDVANAHTEAETGNLQAQPELNQAKLDLAHEKENNTEQHQSDTLDSTLRTHGYKHDEQGNVVPLEYGEMSPQQQAITDLKGSQDEVAKATADLKTAQKNNMPVQVAMAQQRIHTAQQNANTAAGRLGLSGLQYQMRAHGTDGQGNALPGAALLDDDTPVGTAFQQNVRPTGTERNKGDMAQSAHEQLGTLKSIVSSRPDIFGPAAGRKTDFNVWLGSQDPDAQRFRAARTIAGDHLAGTFGGRSEAALQSLDNAIGQFKDNPKAVAAGLDQLDKANNVFLKRGTPRVSNGQGGSEGGTGSSAAVENPSSGKAVSLKAAMGLPVNKGKSEADVRKDIESHGHQVGP